MLCGGLRPIRNLGHWRLPATLPGATASDCLSHSSRRWRCERLLGWASFGKLEHVRSRS